MECRQKKQEYYPQKFESVNNHIIEETFKVFDNDEPHQLLIGNKSDILSLFIYIF